MVDAEALDEYVAVGQDIRALSAVAVARLIESLDLEDALDAVAQLERLLPSLVTQYGELSAVAAADYYERSRPKSLKPTKRVLVAAVVDDLGPAIGWSATPLFQAEPDKAGVTSRLQTVTDARVKTAGTDTILEMSTRDKVKPMWARVPVGDTCDWCKMLGSQGWSYKSANSAGEGRAFHANCECQIVPSWDENPTLEGYDPDALREEYKAELATAQSAGWLTDQTG